MKKILTVLLLSVGAVMAQTGSGIVFPPSNWLTSNSGFGWVFGNSIPYNNNALNTINIGNFPSTAFVIDARHLSGIRSAVALPQQAGGSSVVPIGGSFYAQNLNIGGAAFGIFTSVSARNDTQQLFAGNMTVSDCEAKKCFAGTVTHPTLYANGLEVDTLISDPGTQNSLAFSVFASPTSVYQPATSTGYSIANGSSLIQDPVFSGSGSVVLTAPNSSYDGNGPGGRVGDVAGYAVQLDGTGPNTYRWSAFIASCDTTGCITATDFTAGAGNTISSASHYFTAGDVGAVLQMKAGAGCSIGDHNINSVTAGVATVGGSAITNGATCTAAVWAFTQVTISGTGVDIALVLPVDTTASATLNGAQIRPIATSYGVSVRFSATTGGVVNDNWLMAISYVNTIHIAFRARHGGVDIGYACDQIHNGPLMPSCELQLTATDQNGTGRISGIYAETSTSSSNLNSYHLNAAAAAFKWLRGAFCKYGGCTLLGIMDNQGTLVVAGGVMGVQGLPLLANTGNTVLTAGTSYLTACTSNGTSGAAGNCIVGSTIVRSAQSAGVTDATDTATNIVNLLNSQNAGMCRVGMQWPFNYQNAGAVPITLSADATVTFQPVGNIAIPAHWTLQMTVIVTNCASPAVTFATLGIAPTIADFPQVQVFPVASCVNATATALINTPASAFTAACRGGTNNLTGVFSAAPSAGASAQIDNELPLDWNTANQPYVSIYYGSGGNTSGTVIWTVSTACMGPGDGSVSDNLAFQAETAFATQTMTATSRSWKISGQLTKMTSGNGCVVGSNYILKVAVSGSAAAISMEKVVVTTPRLTLLQAN